MARLASSKPAHQLTPVEGTIVDPAAIALQAEIESFQALDLDDLRSRWRQRLRSAPPHNLPRALLLRLLAYKLQARMHGDLDTNTAKYLDRIARDHARRRESGAFRPSKAVPPVPPALRDRGLKAGTMLVREHAGLQHRVVIMAEGFAWEGRIYTSLSEIARHITGTRWNGPRFFGLRGRAMAMRRQEQAAE